MSASRKERRLSVESLPDLESFQVGSRTDLSLVLSQDPLGNPIHVPFIVMRGASEGPTLGVCAAVHGDELNGIRIIHRLIRVVDPSKLKGTLVCVPIANVPSFRAGQRHFPDDLVDLNHVFPGKRDGKPSEQYARALLKAFLAPIDYLVDIHTASEGRVNSLYVRADLHSRAAREMALVVGPEIVLHGQSGDGTLRSAARRQGKPAITLEAGNPDEFQGTMAKRGERGLLGLMGALGMWKERSSSPKETPVVCADSKWLRTHAGGLLQIDVSLTNHVEKGEEIGRVMNAFGTPEEVLRAPFSGIVIGRSRSPLAVPGTRFCPLGRIGEPKPTKEKLEGRLAKSLRSGRDA